MTMPPFVQSMSTKSTNGTLACAAPRAGLVGLMLCASLSPIRSVS
jgi:hypothetical protein